MGRLVQQAMGHVFYAPDGGRDGAPTGAASAAEGNTGQGGPSSGGGDGQTGGGRTFTQADVDRLVGATRQETRERATRDLLGELGLDTVDALKGVVTAHREQEQANQTEAERLTQQLADREKTLETLRQQNREMGLRQDLADLSGELAVADANLAAEALLSSGLVTFGEDGKAQNLEEAVTRLFEKYALLKASAGTNNGAASAAGSVGSTNPSRPGSSPLTREAIARMTPAEINANWEAVQSALSH